VRGCQLTLSGHFTQVPCARPHECNGDFSPTATREAQASSYTACVDLSGTDAVVWIGVVGIVPREGCELLEPEQGAYVNFLTLAASDSEYRAKVIGALSYYRLELLEFEDVRPLSASDNASEEILKLAEELEQSRNPQHVRYATFNTFPRRM